MMLLGLIGISPEAKAQDFQFPFELKGNYMLIKATLNGRDSLALIFDTGATGTVIDLTAVGRSGLDTASGKKGQVAGLGGFSGGLVVAGQKLGISGLPDLRDVNVAVMDLSSFRGSAGSDIDGFIGFELMKRYVVGIDYVSRRISLYRQIGGADNSGFTAMDVQLDPVMPIPVFRVTMKLENGSYFTGRVLFDSGYNGSLLVSAAFNNFHGISAQIDRSENMPLSGVVETAGAQVAEVSSLRFGPFRFAKVRTVLPLDKNATPRDGDLGILGAELIRQFHVVLDYRNKKIYLKPNHN